MHMYCLRGNVATVPEVKEAWSVG